MNTPSSKPLMTEYLAKRRSVVETHKLTPMAEAYAQEQGAHAFQDLKRMVRDLGVHKTLTMLADVCTEASQLEDDSWEKAAIAIGDCADICKLDYDEPDCDENEDSINRALDNRTRLEDYRE